MPTVNIPPAVRLVLYLLGAVSLLVVSYAVDKSWAGDAEVRLVTGLAALLNVLAAAKTNLSETKQLDVVAGQVNVTPDTPVADEELPADVEPNDDPYAGRHLEPGVFETD